MGKVVLVKEVKNKCAFKIHGSDHADYSPLSKKESRSSSSLGDMGGIVRPMWITHRHATSSESARYSLRSYSSFQYPCLQVCSSSEQNEELWYVQLLNCVRLCGSTECSPPGSSVHGILQARIQELGAMPSSRGSS